MIKPNQKPLTTLQCQATSGLRHPHSAQIVTCPFKPLDAFAATDMIFSSNRRITSKGNHCPLIFEGALQPTARFLFLCPQLLFSQNPKATSGYIEHLNQGQREIIGWKFSHISERIKRGGHSTLKPNDTELSLNVSRETFNANKVSVSRETFYNPSGNSFAIRRSRSSSP